MGPDATSESVPEVEAEAEVATSRTRDYVPTEADYERARTVGAGNEPELPAGVVRKN
jgi:hypothetical protein